MPTPLLVTGSAGTYEVTSKLGGTKEFTLYTCHQDPKGPTCILKIAKTAAHNGLLDREALLLRELREEAARCDEEYAKTNPTPVQLNFQLCFPNLLESFIATEHDGRRVNILQFDGAPDIKKLVPIGHITSRDRVRVDPKTSAWMMGKLLNLLAFAHGQDIAINYVDGDNILIERDQHYVVIFDWTKATLYPEGIPPEVVSAEIAKTAHEVTKVLGGSPETGELPTDEQLSDGRYADILQSFGYDYAGSASEAHEEFYRLIRDLWPRKFHPFTVYPLT